MQMPSQAEAFSGRRRQRRRFHQRRCQPQAGFAAGHQQEFVAADAGDQPGGGDPGGADQLGDPLMGEAEGQVAPVAAAAAQAPHQQAQQGMEALFGAAEMADAQQLQGPFVHRIEAVARQRLGVTAEEQRRERLHADPLAAEAVGAELIARLQEGQGHAFGFLTGAVDPGDAFEHLKAAGPLGPGCGVEQHGLAGGHAQGGHGLVGQETELHQIAATGRLLRMTRNLSGGPALLQVVRNKRPVGRLSWLAGPPH